MKEIFFLCIHPSDLLLLEKYIDRILIFVSHDESIIKDQFFSHEIFIKNGLVKMN